MRVLADGSRLVKGRVGQEEGRVLEGHTVPVREMRGRVRRPGGAWNEVRLWTSFLDKKAHPALELLGRYARRWEQEIAYREIKVDLRASGDLPLASHAPDTAAQEVATLCWSGSAVGILAALQPHWLVLSVSGDPACPRPAAGAHRPDAC